MIAARQIFLGRGGGAKLPYDAEVEYLESTGTQYILIPVVQTANTHINCRAAIISANTNVSYIFAFSSPSLLALRFSSSVNVEALGSAGSIQIGQLDIGTTHTYDFVVAGTGTYPPYAVKIDDVSVGRIYGRGIDGTGPLSLFAYANGTYKASCRIYSAYVSNGTNVADLITVRVGIEGAMYDRVSGRLFRNQGTGAFLYGNDK